MKRRVLIQKDGSVAIIIPSANSRLENEPEEVWLKRVFDNATPEGLQYVDVDEMAIPSSREDREYWIFDAVTGTVRVSETKKSGQ